MTKEPELMIEVVFRFLARAHRAGDQRSNEEILCDIVSPADAHRLNEMLARELSR
jgi:hypothetical protein